MSRLAIKVEHLSKAYQLGQIGTGTISRDIERWWTTKILRKEDPFLQIGQTNDRTIKGDSDIVWSLRDLNFEVEQGEVLGVIGRNGAGKSTLLKLLSRVTAPTDGRIKIKGRIASLLEVGTGFHPELTGRENIFLNGAILGMRKQEIAAKFDEIVAFSGVERYIDTPVKRYSSGMYVRLAFAVAAHLESEILIVDEVLAVGDAEFQKKCLGKMGEVSKGEGKTVLFVSHNLGSISSLCKNSILLKNGKLELKDKTSAVLSEYLRSDSNSTGHFKNNVTSTDFYFEDISIVNSKSEITAVINSNEEFSLIITYVLLVSMQNLQVAVRITNEEGVAIFTTSNLDKELKYRLDSPGKYAYKIEIPKFLLKPGSYSIIVAGFQPSTLYQTIENCLVFKIEDTGSIYNFFNDNRQGIVSPLINWKKI
jgi:lipopolysaccharide transport system ATP-binding protein